MAMARGRQRAKEPPYAAAKPTVDELLVFGARLNRTSVDFLMIEAQTALTFSGIALGAHDEVKKSRNCRFARQAYDTVLRLSDKVTFTDRDKRILSRDLRRLKGALRSLGEVV